MRIYKVSQNFEGYFTGNVPDVGTQYLGTSSVEASQISGMFGKAHEAINLVNKFDSSLLLNISFIFNFGKGGAYGVYLSELDRAIKTKALQKKLEGQGYIVKTDENGGLTAHTKEGIEKSQEEIQYTIDTLYRDLESKGGAAIGINMGAVLNSARQDASEIGSSDPELWQWIGVLHLGGTIVHEAIHAKGARDEPGPEQAEQTFTQWALPIINEEYKKSLESQGKGETFTPLMISGKQRHAQNKSWYKKAQLSYYQPKKNNSTPIGSDLMGRFPYDLSVNPYGGGMAGWSMLMQQDQKIPLESRLGRQNMTPLPNDIDQANNSIEEQLRKNTRGFKKNSPHATMEELLSEGYDKDRAYTTLEGLLDEKRPKPLMVPLKKASSNDVIKTAKSAESLAVEIQKEVTKKPYNQLSKQEQQNVQDYINKRTTEIKTQVNNVTQNPQEQSWIYDRLFDKSILTEDLAKVKDIIAKFNSVKNSSKFERKEIMSYMSFSDLYRTVTDFIKKGANSDIIFDYGKNKIILDKDGYKAIEIDSFEDGGFLLQDTGWCVQYEDTFNSYEPPFFLILKDNKKYALLHPQSGQLKDTDDAPIERENIDPKFIQFIKDVLDVTNSLIYIQGNTDDDYFADEDSVFGDFAILKGSYTTEEIIGYFDKDKKHRIADLAIYANLVNNPREFINAIKTKYPKHYAAEINEVAQTAEMSFYYAKNLNYDLSIIPKKIIDSIALDSDYSYQYADDCHFNLSIIPKKIVDSVNEDHPQIDWIKKASSNNLTKTATLFGWMNNLTISDGSTIPGLGDRVMAWEDRDESFSGEEDEIASQPRYNPTYDIKGFYYRWIEPMFQPQLWSDFMNNLSNIHPAKRFATTIDPEVTNILKILSIAKAKITKKEITSTRFVATSDVMPIIEKLFPNDLIKINVFHYGETDKKEEIYSIWLSAPDVEEEQIERAEKFLQNKDISPDTHKLMDELLGLSKQRDNEINTVINTVNDVCKSYNLNQITAKLPNESQSMPKYLIDSLDFISNNIDELIKVGSLVAEKLGVNKTKIDKDGKSIYFMFNNLRVNFIGE